MKLWQFFNSSKKWTQKASARDSSGRKVLATSDRAVCWCLLGACHKLGISLAYVADIGVGFRFNDSCKSFRQFRKKLRDLDI